MHSGSPLGAINNGGTFSVTTQTCRTDEAEIASDSYACAYDDTNTSDLGRLQEYFQFDFAGLCSCQRNLLQGFIGLAKSSFRCCWVFFWGVTQ